MQTRTDGCLLRSVGCPGASNQRAPGTAAPASLGARRWLRRAGWAPLALLLLAALCRPAGAQSLGTIDFGDVALGDSVTFLNGINHTGTTPATISAVTLSGSSDFQLVSDTCAGATLQRGDTCFFQVQFTPSGLGVRSATLTITGNFETATITFTGTGVAPSITCPANMTVPTDPNQCGAVVNYPEPTAVGAAGAITCTPPSGSFFPVGTTTVNCQSASGAVCSFTVTVTATNAWMGVLPPINADGSSVFKAGSTVPVKFALGCTGSVAATLSWSQLTSGVPGPVNAADSPGAATSGNQFRYDPTTGQYTFNWSTKGLAPGTYELQIDLGDGVPHTVTLTLR